MPRRKSVFGRGESDWERLGIRFICCPRARIDLGKSRVRSVPSTNPLQTQTPHCNFLHIRGRDRGVVIAWAEPLQLTIGVRPPESLALFGGLREVCASFRVFPSSDQPVVLRDSRRHA